mmetsp:Transcript_78672/g.202630  ORF Transcript_78672/g.202630 Transcript_78672/m.202630 type:complete len:999 (+) Transcript_78672:99-3095(+)
MAAAADVSFQDLSPPYSVESAQDEVGPLLLKAAERETVVKWRPAVALAAAGIVAAAVLLLIGTGSMPGSGALRDSLRGFQLKAESKEFEKKCCSTYTVECLACQRSESVEEYCRHPDEDGIHLCEHVQHHKERAEDQQAERDVLLHALNDLMGFKSEDHDTADNMNKEDRKDQERRKKEEAKKKQDEEKERKEREEKEKKRKEELAEKRKEERIEKRLRMQQKREAQREKRAQEEGAEMQAWWEHEKMVTASGAKADYAPQVIQNASTTGPSLYCFSLMMPFGYEPGLLATQRSRGVGIFSCDESTVFSNLTHLVTGEASPVPIELVDGSLAVAYGGRWGTALNTGVFNRLWTEVIRQGRYRYHDWVVKVDPDAVFFPERLREMLALVSPMSKVHTHGKEPAQFQCGACQLDSQRGTTCSAHVKTLQQQGHSCSEALELAARPPPADCGCACDDFSCDLPGEAMYLNNCKWGLHGPIEVLSRRAVATYVAGLPKCVKLLDNPWGEDKFLDQCMISLGVKRVDEFHLLSETACGEQPAPCGTSDVAFHPFKSMDTWQVCAMKANHRCPKPTTTTTVTSTTSATRTTTFTSSLRASQYGMAASDIYSQGYQGTASSQASSTSFACSTMCDFNQTADTCEAHYQLIASSQFAGSEEACASAYALVLRICPGCWRCSLDDARCVSPALIAMSPMAASADQAAAAAAAGQSADRSPAPTAAEDVSTSQAAFDEPATDTVDAVEEPAAYPAAVDVPTSQPSAEPSAYPAATDSPSLQAALDAAEASAYQAATDFPGPQAAEEAEEPSGHAAATDFPQPAPYPATTDVPSPQAAEEVAPFAASADVPASGAAEEAAPFAASADMPASGAAGAAREPTPPVAADVPAAQAIRAIPARQDVAESAALSSMGAEIVTFQDLVRQRTSGAGTSPDAATQGAVKVASPAAEALDASAASTSAAAASTSGAAAWDDPYNCNADYKDWKWGWSSEKAVWCCKHFHRGCRVES